MKIRELTLIPILGTIIFLTSLIKIPSIFPGSEFQMSAPISVLIAMTFGPRIYILAGLIGSFLSFFTGISKLLGLPLISLLIPAFPGMIISGILAKLFYEKICRRLLDFKILEETT